VSAARIALIGSRGVPANYGGYETLMEELGPRLVERGFEVTVYCRSHHTPADLESHRGMRLVVLPTIRRKYLDTPLHTLLSVLHAGSQPFHAALVVNSANALFVPLLRAAEVPTALNVDGIEKRRAKWGWPGRWVYALSERLATRVADTLITDAEVIADHYLRKYGARSEVITYGVDARPVAPGETLRRLGLQPRRYFLYVSRFEPENNPHRVAEAYRRVGGDLPLVMVGGAPYANRFIDALTADADPRILFPGPIYGRGYRELLSSALSYIQATEVGGTHPALVEAMGYGAPLLCLDTPEHREVAADCARYFTKSRPEALADLLDAVLADPAAALRAGVLGAQRARECYSWEIVADRYARVFAALAARGRGPVGRAARG
jgi:glycosyltransferase involved in cell wall biosynthesis